MTKWIIARKDRVTLGEVRAAAAKSTVASVRCVIKKYEGMSHMTDDEFRNIDEKLCGYAGKGLNVYICTEFCAFCVRYHEGEDCSICPLLGCFGDVSNLWGAVGYGVDKFHNSGGAGSLRTACRDIVRYLEHYLTIAKR